MTRAVAVVVAFLAVYTQAIAQTDEHLFVACDNGIRCIRAPCPTHDVFDLTAGQRLQRTDIDLSKLSAADQQRPGIASSFYYASLVYAGHVVRSMYRVGEREAVSLKVEASRIVRPSTAAEAKRCTMR